MCLCLEVEQNDPRQLETKSVVACLESQFHRHTKERNQTNKKIKQTTKNTLTGLSTLTDCFHSFRGQCKHCERTGSHLSQRYEQGVCTQADSDAHRSSRARFARSRASKHQRRKRNWFKPIKTTSVNNPGRMFKKRSWRLSWGNGGGREWYVCTSKETRDGQPQGLFVL